MSEALRWDMSGDAGRMVDWDLASRAGGRLSGSAEQKLSQLDRARLLEDFGELVPHAQDLVSEFTGLVPSGYRARPWVMTRNQWIDANLRGFQRVLEPLAQRVYANDAQARNRLRSKGLGLQIGMLMGYVSRKVLGQYDLFLPPDDDGLLYFVAPNVAGVERRFGFQPRDFRLWISLHEVSHRVQFGAVPWLRTFLLEQVDEYLSTVELDPKRVLAMLRRAVDEVRSRRGRQELLLLLMTPEQREIIHRIQAMMSLLEGHANFVMDHVGEGRVTDAKRMQRSLKQRRRSSGLERTFQRVIGFDAKIRQYAVGESFVSKAVEKGGMERFNRVWESQENLPTLEEIAQPEAWLARVASD